MSGLTYMEPIVQGNRVQWNVLEAFFRLEAVGAKDPGGFLHVVARDECVKTELGG